MQQRGEQRIPFPADGLTLTVAPREILDRVPCAACIVIAYLNFLNPLLASVLNWIFKGKFSSTSIDSGNSPPNTPVRTPRLRYQENIDVHHFSF